MYVRRTDRPLSTPEYDSPLGPRMHHDGRRSRVISAAGTLVGIELHDDIIIGSHGRWFSFQTGQTTLGRRRTTWMMPSALWKFA